MSEHTTRGTSGGVWSCIDDLLIIWGALMKELTNTTTVDEPRVFKNARLNELMAPHTLIPDPAAAGNIQESSYGMGFFRTMLPNQLLKVGPDYALLSQAYGAKDAAPVVGDRNGRPRLMIGHWGSASGASVGTFIFPETRSVAITLVNGTRTVFASDYMVGALVEGLFGQSMARGTDWLAWTERTWEVGVRWGREMDEKVKRGSEVGQGWRRRENGEFVGRYGCRDGMLRIDVEETEDRGLRCLFQGREEESFELVHWEEDIFCWYPGMENLLRMARDDIRPLEFFLLEFKGAEDGRLSTLEWMYAAPERMVLVKEE